MKATFVAPAFIGTAFATVAARDLNGPCAPNSESTAPAPLVNTLAGFNEWTGYSVIALNTQAPTGYETTLANGNCAISSSKYMLYSKLKTYDVQACADICDVHRGCDAFNIYVQREPSIVPGAGCPNPKAMFSTICALYSEPVPLSKCTNQGQYIGPEDAEGEAFKTAIRASNIYARLPAKDATKVVTTTRNIFYDKQSLRIQTLRPSETTTAKEIGTIVGQATSLQSLPTAMPAPPSIIDDINAAVNKLVSVKLITPTISETASPLSAPAAVISVTPSAQQTNTIVSHATVLQPVPTTVLSSIITQAPSVKQVGAATTEVANTPSARTNVSAAVLLGTPFAKQVNTPSSEAVNTPAPATPLIAVAPGTPSVNLVDTATAILQSKLTTLLTTVILQAPSISQAAKPIVEQLSAPTATPTAPTAETPLPVLKRWNWQGRRHGILNKP